MSFKDTVAADNMNVFMNPDEFAEKRTVIYDGVTYTDIPIILSGLKEQDRKQLVTDHIEGLYLVTSVMHCAAEVMNNTLPKKDSLIKINSYEGSKYFNEFEVKSSVNEMGMFRVELGAIDE